MGERVYIKVGIIKMRIYKCYSYLQPGLFLIEHRDAFPETSRDCRATHLETLLLPFAPTLLPDEQSLGFKVSHPADMATA